jgi:hypothetical protein
VTNVPLVAKSYCQLEAIANPFQVRRRAIEPVITSLAVSKGRSTMKVIAVPSEAGRRLVFPGFKASGSNLTRL